MKEMSGGQAAVEALKAEDTKYVFGLIGSATMEMFDALYGNVKRNRQAFRRNRFHLSTQVFK